MSRFGIPMPGFGCVPMAGAPPCENDRRIVRSLLVIRGWLKIMPRQLLIYDSVVPLSAARHRECSVEIGNTYEFSGKVNSVPLMAVEFPEAANEYAIVFAGAGASLMPAFIIDTRDTENL